MSEDWSSILQKDLQKLSEVAGIQPAKTEQLIVGERRDVAILFLDLKGFTAMSETMDHEMVHKVVGGIMQALSSVVKGHGGYVDKFEGDLIMALFGATIATENDCIRAVACGLKMFDVIREVNQIFKAKGYELGARCGISYGSVTVAPDPKGNLTAMGDEVNLASRMESSAEVNTIQVTANVQKECGDYFDWEDLGEITVKGKKKPVHTYRPTGPGKVQKERWERAARVSRSPMVGREKEMRILKSWWDKQTGEVERNRRGGAKHFVIGIKAEAGIGKSRLVHEFTKQVEKQPPPTPPCNSRGGMVSILKGQTLSYAQPPFWLWMTLLRNYFGIGSDDPDAKMKFEKVIENTDELKYSAPFLAELLSIPSDDPRLKYLDYENKHRETLNALRDLVQHTGNKGRTIIILEDLHWLDETSKEALEFTLANCNTEKPLLVLYLYRPEGKTTLPVINDDYIISDEITLSIIEDDACRQLIESMLGSASTEVENFLLKHSQGNPFFLEEFVLDMIESGQLKEEDGIWNLSVDQDSLSIPSSMTGLIHSRIDRLPSEQKAGLQHSSVIGMEFLMRLYRRLTEKVEATGKAEEILSELEKRDFIAGIKDVSDLRYVFKHILTCNTAYDTILKHNRVILHRYIAEALEELFPDDKTIYADIAYHYEQAEDWDKAREYYTKAGEYFEESVRYNEASVSFRKALSICERVLEPEHPDVATSLNNLAFLYRSQGLYDKAEPLYVRALEIREHVLGNQHPDFAASLTNLAILYYNQGFYDKAEPLFERALEIREPILGNQHPDFAASLNNLAMLYCNQGFYDKAEPLQKKALEIREHVLGNQHPLVAASLNNLAILYHNQGFYDKVEPLYERALEIWEHVLGNQHPWVALSLNNLANFYREQGLYDKAEPLYERALEIFETVFGPQHVSVSNSLNDLADFYRAQGLYDKAEPLFERALEIREKVLGPQHPDFALSLNNLAMLYQAQGLYDKAEPLYERALEILEHVLGNQHPLVASSLNNLANLYREQGLYDKAEPLFERAQRIWETSLGPKHPSVARSLNGLAKLYQAQGLYDKAEPLFERAQRIWETSLGPKHPSVAHSLKGLAKLYQAQGLYDKAEPLFLRSIAIMEMALPDHPNLATAYERYVKLLEETGREEEAKEMRERAQAIRDKNAQKEKTWTKAQPYN